MTLSVLAYVNKKRRIKVIREHGVKAKTAKVGDMKTNCCCLCLRRVSIDMSLCLLLFTCLFVATSQAIGEEITFSDDVVVMTELKGDTQTGKDRPVKCSLEVKRKTIHLFFQAAQLRKIDLTAQQQKVEIVKAKGKPLMVLKFEVGYDLALEIDSEDVYTEVSFVVVVVVVVYLLYINSFGIVSLIIYIFKN